MSKLYQNKYGYFDQEAGEYVIQVTSENEPTVTKNVTVGQCAEETPKYFLQTSHATTCGQVTISLRNVSPWLYGF